jgi:hypothetical protein
MTRALSIQVRIAVEEDELEAAKGSLEMLKSLVPDYPELARLEMLVQIKDIGSSWSDRWLENVHRYHVRQLKKPISAGESLASSLDRVSREALAMTLRFWGLPTVGRKAELISSLVEAILAREYLEWKLPQMLNEEERQALAWVLQGGGIRPWKEFTGRYGDDFDESPYWQYHEPESIPGRLRMAGLLAVGTLDGEYKVLIPEDLRPLLIQIL